MRWSIFFILGLSFGWAINQIVNRGASSERMVLNYVQDVQPVIQLDINESRETFELVSYLRAVLHKTGLSPEQSDVVRRWILDGGWDKPEGMALLTQADIDQLLNR